MSPGLTADKLALAVEINKLGGMFSTNFMSTDPLHYVDLKVSGYKNTNNGEKISFVITSGTGTSARSVTLEIIRATADQASIFNAFAPFVRTTIK
jgi:hypothetical protein